MLVKLESVVAMITCGCLVSLAASPSSIGFVVTNGEAVVDGAAVQRNSTLFQGSLVQADTATSDLVLPGGANLLLQPGSSANVYAHYAVLRSGTATERGYVVFADGLRVASQSAGGAVVVGLKDHLHLDVSAQGTAAEVRNPAGTLVARLEAGKTLSLAVQAQADGAPQQAPAAPASSPEAALPEPGQQLTLHGIVRKDHAGRYGHYLLTDLASHITFELQGPGLDDPVGGSVEVTGTALGTTPAPGSSRVLSVFDIHQMTMSEINGGNEPPEPAPAAEPPAAAPPTASGGTTPAAGPAPEVAAQPPAAAPAEPVVESIPAAVTHSDTAKIVIIVALAAGAGVGVALGLAGGKSSTVSPE